MALSDWLKEFRAVHAEAKRSGLDAERLGEYQAARDELARALLSAQHVALEPGQKPRRALRVSHALAAEIAFSDRTVKVATRSVSSGGFAALLALPPKTGEEGKVTLRMPGGEVMQAAARVVEVKSQTGSAHVSFAWLALSEAEVERIETFVFDVVLEQLQG
ncbi:MAG TPA: PilZ domain-containing protein [Anaeromyxobacter sp.]|nr:PilZ domain-containing protein [Anaeromyxobacter sp.]